MASGSIDDLLKDITMVQSWIAQQMQMNIDCNDIQQAQVQSIRGKIDALRMLTPDCATRLLKVLMLGPWRKDEIELLSNRLTDKVAQASVVSPTKTGYGGISHSKQRCYALEKYLTAGDWIQLQDETCPIFMKIDTLIRRCLSLGLYYPDAATSSRMTCILQVGPIPASATTTATTPNTTIATMIARMAHHYHNHHL